MGKKILLLSLVLSLLFCMPVFAAPEDEVVSGDTAPEVVLSEEEISLNSFKEQVNNKGKEDGTKVYITIIKAPVEADVVTDSEGNGITEGLSGIDGSNGESTPIPETLYFTISANGENEAVKFFSVDDEEFDLWMKEIFESVLADAKAGLEILDETQVTLDHIKLDTWGLFFNDYYGKTLTNFPVKDIELKYGDYEFIFKRTDESKDFFLNTFIPPLIDIIEKEAVNYPVKRYALQINSGSLLKDYSCDLTSVREIETILPFDGVEEHIFYNVGNYFGMGLSRDYVDVLRGYLEGDTKGYDRPVKGEVPGCVNVLAYITLLRDISGGTLSDKVLSDFTMYKELAVCLDTKELIDTTDMTTANQDLRYGDFKLNSDILVLCPIKDTVVIIQPTYLECFLYGGVNQGLARWIDTTNFISTGDTNFIVRYDGGETTVPAANFCDANGVLDTRLGQAPFLMYYTSYVPYDLLVNWGYNQSGGYFSNDDQRTAFIDRIESDMKSQGRLEEFENYVKAAGQTPDSTKKLITIIIVAVVLIAVLIVVIAIYKKVKKLNSPVSNPHGAALFEDNDFNTDDDDDDDYGSFELK